MLTAALVLGALLAVAAVVFVARPLIRGGADEALETPDEAEQRRLALAEERDRALAALKELEFDHRTGKVSDEDYRALVSELRRAAADALRALDRGTGGTMSTNAPNPGSTIEPLPPGAPEPPVVPEPEPVPHEPPGPVIVPEPEPAPHEPPGPVIVPEPDPLPPPRE
ncbi:MAG TPA: hypothetical protein VFA24_06530 [Gaiellaceae bacterium]|nr:hypothetical protein [Gaiellaceae bacterium]